MKSKFALGVVLILTLLVAFVLAAPPALASPSQMANAKFQMPNSHSQFEIRQSAFDVPVLASISSHRVGLGFGMLGFAGLAMLATSQNARDGLLKLTLALPNGAATVTSTSIDTGVSTTLGYQEDDVEYEITALALTTGQLADAATMTFQIVHSPNADLSGGTVVNAAAIVQTGAGGAGAALKTFRFKAASDWGRYIGFKATNSGAGNCSGVNATLEVLV